MSVYDENSWRIAYETAYSKMGMMELYVQLNPVEIEWRAEMFTGNQPGSSSGAGFISQQSCDANTIAETSRPANRTSDFVPIPTDDEEENDDEDYNIDTENESSGEDDEDADEIEEDEDIGPNVSQLSQYNPFRGRGWVHPAKSFHDCSSWVPADTSFIESSVIVEGPLAENQAFSSKDALKNAISKWHIDNNREIKVQDSSKTKYRVRCKDENCSWMLYAARTGSGDAWSIRKCPYKHICRSTAARFDHAQLTAKMMADIIREDVENNVSLPIKQVFGLVRKIFPGVNPKYNKLWRAREIVVAYMFGSWSGSYALLPQLLNAIKQSNPGSKVVVHSDPLPCAGVRQFKCAAWAFGPCIQAFKYLRPVISIDASFLKGRYEGRLLVAVGYDAENQLLPLAFGLVEKENISNWGWFMRWLRREVIGDRKICVISDRHAAIKHIFRNPGYGWHEEGNEAVHRLCAQHLAENLLKNCKNQYAVDAFKAACRHSNPWDFKASLEQVEYWSKDALQYIKGIGKKDETNENEPEVPSKWSLCHDGGQRWGIMTSNAAECLNNVFKEARGLPICAIVEATYYKLLEWFNNRRQHARVLAQRGHIFSERVTQILEKSAAVACQHEVKITDFDTGVYEVISKHERVSRTGGRRDRSYKVILRDGTRPKCKCRGLQNTGIACSHVLAVCAARNYNANEYTHSYYSVNSLVHTWEGHFDVYGKEEDWPEYMGDKIIPDRTLVKKGRRRSKRLPMTMDVMEGRIGPGHCTGCGSINHTSDRCNVREG